MGVVPSVVRLAAGLLGVRLWGTARPLHALLAKADQPLLVALLGKDNMALRRMAGRPTRLVGRELVPQLADVIC